MVDKTLPASGTGDFYPGQRLGLPAAGRGSLATWSQRITALVVDWAASTLLAFLVFGPAALTGNGWRSLLVPGVFFVETTVLSALTGASLGQLVTRITVLRLDRRPLGWLRAASRAALVCAVLPALVIGLDRRGLHDTAVGTVVVRRR